MTGFILGVLTTVWLIGAASIFGGVTLVNRRLSLTTAIYALAWPALVAKSLWDAWKAEQR